METQGADPQDLAREGDVTTADGPSRPQTNLDTPSGRTTAKKELRAQLRAARRQRWDQATDSQHAAWGLALATGALAAVDAVRTGGAEVACITSYESRRGEPPTTALNQSLLSAGLRVLVPLTLPDLDLDWQELIADGSLGEPLGVDGIAQADLVLTPGLCIAEDGTRLGQGGGCYDRALPRRREGVQVITLIHDEELVPGPLPRAPFDQPVDGVITPSGGYRLLG